ncbi:protein kinase [Streptosporangium sp. NPDC049376]|uniref:serine/threonine-protein kinase n=1 Tax=Streptosporangium sp. NPDC049376 TaxID=3366192 RepID=UPI0037A0EB7B
MTERKVAGRYRLLEPIGEGGMGVVWRSHDELLDRVVAVKEVRYRGIDEAARADLNRRTIREARSAGRLDHPSVIIVHDVVEEEGRPWIVMQLVRSRSMGEVVRRGGPLPPSRVAEVGLQVLGALRAAHTAGVLHRDVKPENVLLADDGRVVLTDFGIASMTQETGITRTGGMVGTPAFLPPERLHGMPATPESDLWSLGATLYAALEGRPPFERPTAAATMMAVLNGEPSPMSHTGSLVSAILGLMAREPAARLTADAAEALLTRACTEAPGGAAGTDDRPPQAGPAPRHGRPHTAEAPHTGNDAFPHPNEGPYTGGHTADPRHGGEPWRQAAPQPGPQPMPQPGPQPGTRPGAAPWDASPWTGQPAGQPVGPGQAASWHTGQAGASHGDPSSAGQAPYPGDPAHSPYRDDATRVGRPSYPNDPFQAYHPGGQAHPGDPSSHGQGGHPLPENPFGGPLPGLPHGTEPAYQGPGRRRGRRAAPGSQASPRRPAVRRAVLIVGIPVLVAGFGAGGWLLADNFGAGRTATPTPPATSAPSIPSAKPSKSPRPSPTASPTVRPSRLPEGWQYYKDPVMGFTMALPRGWTSKRFSGRDRVEFRRPGSSALLWIESTADPEKDPVKHWENLEKDRVVKKLWPGYERIGITPLRYRGVEAADWEFTYLKNGVRTHVLDRGFHTITGRPYAIYWESPESEWDRAFFDRFTETFRP